MQLRIHRFLPFTRAEGPGDRACLWVQGCPIRCPGCAVPWTWPADGGRLIGVEALALTILEGPTIEGVTFVGGEPFGQAAALACLARHVRSHGLSVMTFSGYALEEITAAKRADWTELLETTDLLIDGPFRQELTDFSRPWAGSSNQRFHFLTERYRHLEPELMSIPNRLEIRLEPDGRISVNGLADGNDLEAIFTGLARPAHPRRDEQI